MGKVVVQEKVSWSATGPGLPDLKENPMDPKKKLGGQNFRWVIRTRINRREIKIQVCTAGGKKGAIGGFHPINRGWLQLCLACFLERMGGQTNTVPLEKSQRVPFGKTFAKSVGSFGKKKKYP